MVVRQSELLGLWTLFFVRYSKNQRTGNYGNRQKVCVVWFLEYRAMDRMQKPSNSGSHDRCFRSQGIVTIVTRKLTQLILGAQKIIQLFTLVVFDLGYIVHYYTWNSISGNLTTIHTARNYLYA
jgi:hypothetical protein